MKSLIVIVSLFSATAFANPIHFTTVVMKSEKVKGIRKLRIYPMADGKLKVVLDPNYCSDAGICTAMGSSSDVVEARIIKDDRPVDGNLLLGLTSTVNLSIGAGNNPEGEISFTAIVKDYDGTTLRLPLTPEVSVTVGH